MMKLTECPRDAMQGIKEFIPTELKIKYINSLLKVGFDVIDFGSFVSPKAIPQLRDTSDVIKGLELNNDSAISEIKEKEKISNKKDSHRIIYSIKSGSLTNPVN